MERELEDLTARLLQLSRGRRADRIPEPPRPDRDGAPNCCSSPTASRRRCTSLFVDVGNVQELNERLGHQAGDAALQAVARALAVTFRKSDVLARIGGTQFLVLTLHLDGADCAAMTDRIRSTSAHPRPWRSSAPPPRSAAAGRRARPATAPRWRT